MNIDHLTPAELIDLNRRIVERLKRMDSMRQQHQMMAFHIGQRVLFITKEADIIYGNILKLNQKTVSVMAEDGTRWKVSPSLLRPMSAKDITPMTNLLD
jgi:hypothetical protein